MNAQDLRNSILQRAIEGKLVPQRKEEGTAKELLAEIRAEKAKLIKEKKIKKTKPLPAITDDEKPFDIPDNWEWVRLSDICTNIVDCPHSTPKYFSNDTGFYAIDTNVIDSSGQITGWRYVSKESYLQRITRLIPQKNDIVLTREGSFGRAAILPAGKKICLGQRVMLLRPSCHVATSFIKTMLMTPSTLTRLTEKQRGLGAKHINVSDICKLSLPLPPLAEQKRIVAKIETLLPDLAAYDDAQTELHTLTQRFPDDMKKSLLQYAIEGKLVPQRADEGTAKDLLREIQTEKARLIKEKKIKKTKPLPAITDDEKPFELPENWEWVRLGNIGALVRGSGIKRSETTDNGKPCVRYGELYTTYHTRFSSAVSHTSDEVFDKSQKVHHNDILMSLTGENKWDIALAVVYEGTEEIAMGGDMTKWEYHGMNPLYLATILNSPYGISCKRNMATGDIIVHISNNKLSEILLPIPPLAEQHRIVARLEELLPLCEQLAVAP